MVRSAGAREVHLRISCPPTVSPCFYGVDTPNKHDLIAANNTVDEIRRFVEADSLSYLALGELRKAVHDVNDDYCYACYTGNYPTELVNIQDLAVAKKCPTSLNPRAASPTPASASLPNSQWGWTPPPPNPPKKC